MDFTSELAAFQGAIISVDHVHQLPRIASKGGNEDKVNFVIQSLENFLEAENYINNNEIVEAKIPTMRKFAMYIILNADLLVLHDMIDLADIEPVLFSIPILPKYLMCEIIYQLHMETFVFEIIAKCWPQLGIEVAEAFLENFKYLSPTECLDKLGNFSEACYALLCRLHCFKLNVNLGSAVTSVCEIFQRYLKYYIDLPNKHILDSFTQDELYQYKGERFKNFLILVYNCATMYTQDTNPECDDMLYRITYSSDYLHNTTCKVCETPCNLVLEYINNSNKYLLEIFAQIVMDISVDIFCAWSEFEDDSKTMQQSIGEWCDKVYKLLQSINSFADHPVVPMIQLMARKPTDIKDIINATDTPTILEKIHRNDEESQRWIRALVHKENLLRHMDLVHVINDKLYIFDEKECFELFNSFKTVAVDSNSLANRELLIGTKIKLFSKCNVIDKHKILREHFREKLFNNSMMNSEFDSQVNTKFNKFVADIHEDFTDVYTLFYQNPRKVYTKLFGLATQNPKLIEPMLKLMQLLKEYTEYCYDIETEPCVITIIKFILNQRLQEGYDVNILSFICELKKHEVISGSQLLMLVVMPSLHEALLTKDIPKMHIQVELLSKAYTIDELHSYRAPMLVMMAQIMEAVRLRTIGTFQIFAIKTIQIVIKFQKSIVETYNSALPETDLSWLKQKVQELRLHPLNYYYFKYIWTSDTKRYFECVTDQRVHKNARLNVLSYHLTLILPLTTIEEWILIWNNLTAGEIKSVDVLRMFSSAVDVLTQKIETNRTPNTLSCLYYLFGNLVHVMRYKYFMEPVINCQVTTCCVLLAHNLLSTNQIDVNDIGTIIMPLFAYLAERRHDYKVNVPKFFEKTNYLEVVNRYIPNEMEQI